ncbi:MAG: NAD-dependent epimerase/dehydratase family protein [Deltaproteobacteria bacterium]|nr:NAD-dependent epimerase/dehydratase family protein [Deltaproteobacteria bacterium]
MSKRVLITGGAGFIGHNLCRRMLAEGYEVGVIDNEFTGRREDVPGECAYLKGDIRNTGDLAKAFDPAPDVVFHVAAQASNIRSFGDPRLDIDVNIQGTINVVNACVERGVPKLVYAGSMTEYGLMDRLPVNEDAPLRPISYYGISKTAAEHFVLSTTRRPDLTAPFSATVFRMFNVYGPGQSLTNPYQGVLAIFIGQVLRGEPCTVDGDGTQSRDFVYIDDVTRAWAAVAEPGVADGIAINLGSGARLSVNDLVREVCIVLGHDPKAYPIEKRPLRPGINCIRKRISRAPAMSSAGRRKSVSRTASRAPSRGRKKRAGRPPDVALVRHEKPTDEPPGIPPVFFRSAER